MEHLHKGAKWQFRFQIYFIVAFVIFWIGFVMISLFSAELSNYLYLLIPLIILWIIVSEIFVQWVYSNWKYEFTQHELKIEKGIIVKTYKSIPYERIQNVDITRGILARILGFSTLNVQTAGYSYSRHPGFSEGHIPAVSREGAEKIREFLMRRISGKGHSGI